MGKGVHRWEHMFSLNRRFSPQDRAVQISCMYQSVAVVTRNLNPNNMMHSAGEECCGVWDPEMGR